MQDVRHVSQDAVGAAQVSQPSTMFSNFARGEKGKGYICPAVQNEEKNLGSNCSLK